MVKELLVEATVDAKALTGECVLQDGGCEATPRWREGALGMVGLARGEQAGPHSTARALGVWLSSEECSEEPGMLWTGQCWGLVSQHNIVNQLCFS